MGMVYSLVNPSQEIHHGGVRHNDTFCLVKKHMSKKAHSQQIMLEKIFFGV